MEHDSLWKDILEQLFQEFLHFFFPDIARDIDFNKGYQFLDKELNRIIKKSDTGKRIVDKLVKVFLKDGSEKWLLIHIEIQGYRQKDFARRMFVYNYRIFDRYRREVISLALLTDTDANFRPTEYKVQRGEFLLLFRFPYKKIIDYRGMALDITRNPFGLVVQAYLKTLESEGNVSQRYRWKKQFLLQLYRVGFKKETVYALYRFIEWMMALPDELEEQLYYEIKEFEEGQPMSYITIAEKKGVQKGIKEGLQKGIKEGIQKGKIQGLQHAIITILKVKFGEAGLAYADAIKTIEELDKLEDLLEKIEKVDTIEQLQKIFVHK